MQKLLVNLSLLTLVFSQICLAQTKTDGLPITIKVDTSVNLPNGSVQFSGTSNSLDNAAGQVFVEIATPGGVVDKVTASADKQTGSFRTTYSPKGLGKYDVTAFAADRKQSAKTTFTVSAPVVITATLQNFDQAKAQTLVALETSVNSAVAAIGTPEDVAKTKDEVQKVKQKMKEFDNNWGKFVDALNSLQQLAKKNPEVAAIAAPQLGELSSKLSESTDVLRQIEKDLGTSKSQGSDDCNTLYHVSGAAAAFSTAMNLASGGVVAIGKAIFIDKVWPKIAESKAPKSFDSNDTFMFTQAGKAGGTATDGLSALASKSFGAGVAGDLAQYVSDTMFKKLCTEYKGPVSGTYTVEFKKEGKTYLKYKLTYEGTASVFLSSKKLRDTIPKLSGYLEGNVTAMDFTDDVWVLEEKADWDEVKYQRLPAPVAPFSASEKDPGFGGVARGVLPGSFYFPLEAQMVQGKIVIKLMPARSDFTSAFANRTVMVVKGKRKPNRVDGAVFNYPIQPARFILTRSMRMADDSPTVTLDMSTQNGISTMEKEFTRTESPTADVKVDFSLKLKLSNE